MTNQGNRLFAANLIAILHPAISSGGRRGEVQILFISAVFIGGLVFLGLSLLLVAGIRFTVKDISIGPMHGDDAADGSSLGVDGARPSVARVRGVGYVGAIVGIVVIAASFLLPTPGSDVATGATGTSAPESGTSTTAAPRPNTITLVRPEDDARVHTDCTSPSDCSIVASGDMAIKPGETLHPYALVAFADDSASEPQYYVQYDSTTPLGGDAWRSTMYVYDPDRGEQLLVKAVLLREVITPPADDSAGLLWADAQSRQELHVAAESAVNSIWID
jgi:hypothetical protein